jgi:hypothetical protein
VGRLRRRARIAARCRRGAQAVEFAMVASVVIPMFGAALEMAWQSAAAAALDHAALRASRFGSLGRETADGKRAGPACHAAILLEARRAGRGLLNGDLRLAMTSYGSSKQAGLGGGGANNAGLGGQTVVYRLEYHQPFVVVGQLFGLQKHVHTSVATVRNEPYSNGEPDAPPC